MRRAPSAARLGPVLAALGILAVSCADRGPRRGGGVVSVPPPASEADAGADAAADAGAPAPPASVTLSRAAPALPVPTLPRLAIVAPKQNEAIPFDKAEAYLVRVDVKDWLSSPGEHLHLVLDNAPYKPIEDARSPIKLGDIVPNQPLAEGHHVLAVFPARADHSAVKPSDAPKGGGARDGGPLSIVSFWIGKAGKRAPVSPVDPMLLYSRPKGTYNGAGADAVLLDFYVANAPLGEGRFSVLVTVTPATGEPAQTRLTRWEALQIDGLPNGVSRVRLELTDSAGRPVPGTFGAVDRDISVNRDAR